MANVEIGHGLNPQAFEKGWYGKRKKSSLSQSKRLGDEWCGCEEQGCRAVLIRRNSMIGPFSNSVAPIGQLMGQFAAETRRD